MCEKGKQLDHECHFYNLTWHNPNENSIDWVRANWIVLASRSLIPYSIEYIDSMRSRWWLFFLLRFFFDIFIFHFIAFKYWILGTLINTHMILLAFMAHNCHICLLFIVVSDDDNVHIFWWCVVNNKRAMKCQWKQNKAKQKKKHWNWNNVTTNSDDFFVCRHVKMIFFRSRCVFPLICLHILVIKHWLLLLLS